MLAETKEYQTDVLLAHLVRLQLVAEKSAEASWHDPVEMASLRAPPVFYLKALQSQLQAVKRDIPFELQQNGGSTSIL